MGYGRSDRRSGRRLGGSALERSARGADRGAARARPAQPGRVRGPVRGLRLGSDPVGESSDLREAGGMQESKEGAVRAPRPGTSAVSRAKLMERIRALHAEWMPIDRKSTRLNSSHVKTSYAVFCLKH